MEYQTSLTPRPILPTITLLGTTLTCNDQQIDLCRKRRTLLLIKAFSEYEGKIFGRDELINIIYAQFQPWNRSPRLNAALKQNITKLVSRTRSLLEKGFNDNDFPWIEFFIYDHENEGWSFYRLKNEYLRGKEYPMPRVS